MQQYLYLESVEYEVAVNDVAEDVEQGVFGDFTRTRHWLNGARYLLTEDERWHSVSPGVTRQRFHHLHAVIHGLAV